MCESNKIDITRRAFGGDFSSGAATSAYQIEGAWNAGGKGMSNWDYFTQMKAGGVADASDGCVAVDHYNMFKEAKQKVVDSDEEYFSGKATIPQPKTIKQRRKTIFYASDED